MTAPGLLDAGDVLKIGDRFFIALTPRTNEEGAAQLAFFLKEFGYEATVITLDDTGSLRLRDAAIPLGDNRLIARAEVAQHPAFLEYEKIVLPHEERGAAAGLMLNGTVLLPQGYPWLRAELRLMGLPFIEMNISEFEKTGGSLSSLALWLPEAEAGNTALLQDLSGLRKAA
jgi:dimethylargininase